MNWVCLKDDWAIMPPENVVDVATDRWMRPCRAGDVPFLPMRHIFGTTQRGGKWGRRTASTLEEKPFLHSSSKLADVGSREYIVV